MRGQRIIYELTIRRTALAGEEEAKLKDILREAAKKANAFLGWQSSPKTMSGPCISTGRTGRRFFTKSLVSFLTESGLYFACQRQ